MPTVVSTRVDNYIIIRRPNCNKDPRGAHLVFQGTSLVAAQRYLAKHPSYTVLKAAAKGKKAPAEEEELDPSEIYYEGSEKIVECKGVAPSYTKCPCGPDYLFLFHVPNKNPEDVNSDAICNDILTC